MRGMAWHSSLPSSTKHCYRINVALAGILIVLRDYSYMRVAAFNRPEAFHRNCLKLGCDHSFRCTGSDTMLKRVSARRVSEMLQTLVKGS